VTLFAIEPRDPAIFRDGRPFQAGSTAALTLDFPSPSTIAGFVRTCIGSDERGQFDHPDPKELLKVSVRGPWLWRWEPEAQAPTLYVPAPRDCIFFNEQDGLARRRLVPRSLDAGCAMSLDGLELVDLDLDGVRPKTKPANAKPAFWSWAELEAWLRDPIRASTVMREGALGLPRIVREDRIHVAVDPATGTASDGMLFRTEGLRFTTHARERLAIGFACKDERLAKRLGVVAIGGERRPSFLQKMSLRLPELAEPAHIDGARRLRIVLLTPAIFERGAVPREIHGARVVAAVVPRPEVISGWDAAASKPKPTRRMAPAGSVYWVEPPSGTSASAWAREMWMKSVHDGQDQRDGFGLAVVGVA